MTSNLRQTPLTCSGHTRPVVFLAFSEFNSNDAANYYCISACKGNILIYLKLMMNLIFGPATHSLNYDLKLTSFQMENQCCDKAILVIGLVPLKDIRVLCGVSLIEMLVVHGCDNSFSV